MIRKRYIGMDIHSNTSTCCVISQQGKVLQEITLATKGEVLKDFVKGIPGERQVTFEEGTQAAWVYSILKPLCDRIVVCNPAKNTKLFGEQKSDKSDAYHLAQGLRAGILKGVWHGEKKEQDLKDMARTYDMITNDVTRTKNRIRAIYRSRGQKIKGQSIYEISESKELIKKIPTVGMRKRAEILSEELENILELKKEAQKELIEKVRRQKIYQVLQTMPQMGQIRAAIFVAQVGRPERFRTRAMFWSYVGLAVRSYESAQYNVDSRGEISKKRRKQFTRGLVNGFNRPLKYIFKFIANQLKGGEWAEEYQRLVASGVDENNAVLTLARKVAAIALHLAKTGEVYDRKLVFQLRT